MLDGLKAGRTLVQDGWAKPHEVELLDRLEREGKITRTFHEGDQYSCYKVRWVEDEPV
jgi:hypothetical protein